MLLSDAISSHQQALINLHIGQTVVESCHRATYRPKRNLKQDMVWIQLQIQHLMNRCCSMHIMHVYYLPMQGITGTQRDTRARCSVRHAIHASSWSLGFGHVLTKSVFFSLKQTAYYRTLTCTQNINIYELTQEPRCMY